MPFIHSTFINTIHITEIKDREYLFSFINSFSEIQFILKIDKRLFDKSFEERVIESYIEPFRPEPPEIKEIPEMTV